MPLFPCLKPSVVLSAFSVFALVAILQQGKNIYIYFASLLCTVYRCFFIKMQLPLKKSHCFVSVQSVTCFEIKKIR